jgi:hypothetical protein
MSESTLLPQTAPRTLEGLINQSPMRLRFLVRDYLGGLQNDADKMAWHALTTSQARAEYVLQLLKNWDAANPGAAAPQGPAPAPQVQGYQPPIQQPQTNGATSYGPNTQMANGVPVQQMAPVAPGPATVAPGAVAAAAAATADKPRRTPRTSSTLEQQPADVGANILELLTRLTGAIDSSQQSTLNALTSFKAILEEAASGKTSRLTLLETAHANLDAKINAVLSLQRIMLMSVLNFMQEQSGMGILDLLGTAIEDSARLDQLIQQAQGKA